MVIISLITITYITLAPIVMSVSVVTAPPAAGGDPQVMAGGEKGKVFLQFSSLLPEQMRGPAG